MRFQDVSCLLLLVPQLTVANDHLTERKNYYSEELRALRKAYSHSFAGPPSYASRSKTRFHQIEKLIIANNADPNSNTAMRFYPESLYSQEEFARRRLGFIAQSFERKLRIAKKPSRRSTDEYLNYVELGYVTPARDQQDCGSCYSFTAMSVLESALLMRYGVRKVLSVQQGLDCTYSRYDGMNFGCIGGHPFYVLKHATDYEVVDESQYRYKSRLRSCSIAERKQTLNVTAAVVSFDNSDEALKQVLQELGPVSVAIAVGDSTFKHYAGGIITECGTELDHAVVLVGYKDTAEESYWIIKNSWGPKWGENGFARIQMGSSCSLALDNPIGVLLN